VSDKRRETDEERAEREQREAEEARAARAAEIAAWTNDELNAALADLTGDEIKAENRRLARLPDPLQRGPGSSLVARAKGHKRVDAFRDALAESAGDAIIVAARSAAKPTGPSLEDVRRAHDLHVLAKAPQTFWRSIHYAIDQPMPSGMPEVFADVDSRAAAQARKREIEARRDMLDAELESREDEKKLARRPALAERMAERLRRRAGGGR
jgi:hypothetical protein